jgi:hypothetical protein
MLSGELPTLVFIILFFVIVPKAVKTYEESTEVLASRST